MATQGSVVLDVEVDKDEGTEDTAGEAIPQRAYQGIKC